MFQLLGLHFATWHLLLWRTYVCMYIYVLHNIIYAVYILHHSTCIALFEMSQAQLFTTAYEGNIYCRKICLKLHLKLHRGWPGISTSTYIWNTCGLLSCTPTLQQMPRIRHRRQQRPRVLWALEIWKHQITGDLVKQTSYRKEQNSWNIWFCLILIPPSDIRVPRFGNSREHWSLLRIFCIVPHGVIPLGIWARNLLPRIHIFNPKSPLPRLILIHFEIEKWWTNWNSSKLCVEANHLWPVHLRGIDYAMFDKLGAGRCNWVAAPILSLDTWELKCR